MGGNSFVSARWFTRATYVTTAVLTAAVAAALWSRYPTGAKGVIIGGAAGVLAFWMMSRRAASLTTIPKAEIPYRVYRWTFARMLVYAMALIWAYTLDPRGNQALIGAAGGLFLSRLAMILTGIVAWRRTNPVADVKK